MKVYSVKKKGSDGRDLYWDFLHLAWVYEPSMIGKTTDDNRLAISIQASCGSFTNAELIESENESEYERTKEEKKAQFLEAYGGGPKTFTSLQKQEGGTHYKDMAIEPADYIHKNGIGFFAGNAIKYISRYKSKNGAEDIKKAIHYLEMILDFEYGEKR